MKLLLSILIICFISVNTHAQKKKKTEINLTNALVVGQFDNPEDRYLMEIALTELFTQNEVKAIPSLNILKLGESAEKLLNDSVQGIISSKKIDTYVIVSVRGYDRKFKPSETQPSYETAIVNGNIYGLYQPDIVSVSFDFKFYRNGVCVHNEIIKCGGVGDRDSVLKKFRKKVKKRIVKRWI